MANRDLISLWTEESKNYSSLTEMEKLLDQKGSLAALPTLPLYMMIHRLPEIELSKLLPRLSTSQRQAFCDLDLWKRDEINIDAIKLWISAYSECENEEVIREFVIGDTFSSMLKARFNIYTFDVEEPEYPDHDNYFLTEDNLLLFEYDETFAEVDELKKLIGVLYDQLGVENAYAHLFKMVSDSPTSLLEEEYRLKKGRLLDLGMVDYFDAIELLAPFRSIVEIEKFINKKIGLTAGLDDEIKNQGLHYSILNFYEDKDKRLHELLLKVEETKRADYLRFNFIRLNNAYFCVGDDLKRGSVAIGRSVSQIKSLLSLAIDYIDQNCERLRGSKVSDDEFFNLFDFIDLYKIGKSLLSVTQLKLKTILARNGFDDEKSHFLGNFYNQLADNLLSEEPKVSGSYYETPGPINNYKKMLYLERYIELLTHLAPLAREFHKQITELTESGKISDDFYQNYPVSEIDFETLLITLFANFTNGVMVSDGKKKLGLMLSEYLSFTDKIMADGEVDINLLKPIVDSFQESFGPKNGPGFIEYFHLILSEALEGYNFKEMTPEDWKHVGGPILLKF